MRRIWLVPLLVSSCMIIGFLLFVFLSNPLVINGASTYTDGEGRQEIVFQFDNEGYRNITILDVTINSSQPSSVALGVSYDTGQHVQSGVDNPLILFMEVDAEAIRPRLNKEQIDDALRKKEMTPIHYGILVTNAGEWLEGMTITYSYFGVHVRKKVDLRRWTVD